MINRILGLLWQRFTRYFLAGVLAILPVVVTIAVVLWVAQLVQSYVGPDTFIGHRLSGLGLGIGTKEPGLLSYLVGWVLVLAVIFLLGLAIELGAKRLIQQITDMLLNRVPLVGNVYRTSKQIVGMLDQNEAADLKGMSPVFCTFGEQNPTAVLALLVSPEKFSIDGQDYHAVIIPTAPVPFGGGLLFIPTSHVKSAEMSVDGLMSIYVSMGATTGEYLPPPTRPAGSP
jgi:uncharacterized membrane protein